VSRAVEADPIYRFDNQLVRDTVYNSLLKRARATMHSEFVRWADRLNADRDRALEFEAILGYHLEQAHRYLRELGPLDEAGVAIGVDAAARLAAAGRRAFARSDMHAAVALLRRASVLLAADNPARWALLPELGEALLELGEFVEARAVLSEAGTAADKARDERLQMSALLIGMFVRLYSGEPGDWGAEALRAAEAAIPLFERAGAQNDLATAWRLIGFVHGVAGRYTQANAATVHYMAHARKAGNARLVARSGMGFAIGALSGPTPVPEAIVECERIVAECVSDRQVQSVIKCVLAQLRAMNGEFDEARRLYREGRAMLRELGQGVSAASTGIDLARVELLAGDLAGAEREIRADYEFLKAKGETYLLSSLEGMLSRIVRDLGRDDEALALTRSVEAAAAEDDVEAQVQWRAVRAPILARAGDLVGAEALVRAALEMARGSEAPVLQADTLSELAEVLKSAGRVAHARQAMGEAEALYFAKGDVVSAGRAAD
jgi:tetratricopeptide (TPR) repeat protein